MPAPDQARRVAAATDAIVAELKAALAGHMEAQCQRSEIAAADIALRGQFVERLTLDLHAAFRDLTLNPTNEVSFMTTALSMVSANLGVTACLPYARALVTFYRLQMRLLQDPVITRKFFVYTKTGRSLSPAAESFIAFLFRFVEEHDWSGASGTEQGRGKRAR